MSRVVPDIFDTNVKKSKLAKCIRLVEPQNVQDTLERSPNISNVQVGVARLLYLDICGHVRHLHS